MPGSLTEAHREGDEPLGRPYAADLALVYEDHLPGLHAELLALDGHDAAAAYEVEYACAALVRLYLLPRLHADERHLVLGLHPQYPRHELRAKLRPFVRLLSPCQRLQPFFWDSTTPSIPINDNNQPRHAFRGHLLWQGLQKAQPGLPATLRRKRPMGAYSCSATATQSGEAISLE